MYKLGLVQTSDKIGNNVMLPLAIGVVWCHAQQYPSIRNRFELVATVYRKEDIKQQARQLSTCDIICFSSYAWNLAYHLALAREVKQLNPQVYTVFGGPSMAPKNPAFWIENRNTVDIAIDGEGEPGIVSVLESFPTVTNTNVPGAYGLKHVNPLADRRTQFSITDSPYVSGFYDHMIKEIHQRGEVAQAVVQTNRGCPCARPIILGLCVDRCCPSLCCCFCALRSHPLRHRHLEKTWFLCDLLCGALR
jgi:radical SAM superfamily enzyme YgiQ (UPF0313 family)